MEQETDKNKVENELSCTSIRESLCPLIWWMKIFGLYYEDRPHLFRGASGNQNDSRNQRDEEGREHTKPEVDMESVPYHDPDRNPSLSLGKTFEVKKFFEKTQLNRVNPIEVSKSNSPREVENTDIGNAASKKHQLPATTLRERNGRQHVLRPTLQKCYCALISFSLLANLARSLHILLLDDGPGFSYKLTLLIWHFQTTCSTLILFISCWKEAYLRQFYTQWYELYDKQDTKTLGLTPVPCRKFVSAIISISFVAIIVNILLVLVQVYWTELPTSSMFRTMICEPFTEQWSLIILHSVVHVYNTAAWILPIAFTICMSVLMTRQFRALSELIHKAVLDAHGQIPQNLPEFRMCHLHMCRLIDTLNRYFRLHVSITLSSAMGTCTFILYQLVVAKTDTWTLASNLYWFAGGIAVVVFASISLSQLHEAAHSPLEELYLLNPSHAANTQVLQLNLFESKLTSAPIGASVLDLFVVTKEVILTVFGAFFTYFFLVVQFGV